MKKAVDDLIRSQRADGGWAQLPGLESDAYATGQALYALRIGGGMSPTHETYQEGRRKLTPDPTSGWYLARPHALLPGAALLRKRIPSRTGSVDFCSSNKLGHSVVDAGAGRSSAGTAIALQASSQQLVQTNVGMKTPCEVSPTHRDKSSIILRLKTICHDSPRQWGRMSSHQMICHLSDAFRVAIGEKPARLTPNRINQTMIKWIALRAPLQWPKGFQTPPEVNQEGDACTRPLDFQKDLTQLLALIERFTATTKRFSLSAPSHLWTTFRVGVVPLGLPAHGSSPAAVWCVTLPGSSVVATPQV